ncbi:MAG: hypothetical protein M1839_007861 [Geoglossum umbratile]|nr:MAG: hypothetical protein M1839_007861 [Geoglossum umbratile]
MASERSSSPLSSAISMSDPSETLDQPMQTEQSQLILPLGRTTCKHREHLSPPEKLKKALDYLRNELNLSPAEYTRLLFSQDDKGNRIRQKHFIKAAYTSPEILQYLQAHLAARVETLNALEWGVPELRKDIARLAKSELFGKYRVSDKDIASIENAALSATVADKAPYISQLLHAISEPPQSPGSPSRSSRIVMILAILCYSFCPCGSINLPTLIGLYLHLKGVKGVAIELLHHLGVTVSYDAIMNNIRTLSKDSADAAAEVGQAPNAVTVYNNFEQTEGVQEQKIESNSSFHSITTGKVFEGLEIPSNGLDQDMLNPQAALSIKQVLFAPGNCNDEIREQVSHPE